MRPFPRLGKKQVHRYLELVSACIAGLILGLSLNLVLSSRHTTVERIPAAVVTPPPPAQPAPPPVVEATAPVEPPDRPIAPAIINAPVAPNLEPAQPVRSARETRLLACVTPAMRTLWDRLEAEFGRLQIISTCNHSLYVAGSHRVSRHASGNAIDFLPGDQRIAILRWLNQHHRTGLTMTYNDSAHVHIDIGHAGMILAHRDQAPWGSVSGKPTVVPVAHVRPAKPKRARRHRDWDDDD